MGSTKEEGREHMKWKRINGVKGGRRREGLTQDTKCLELGIQVSFNEGMNEKRYGEKGDTVCRNRGERYDGKRERRESYKQKDLKSD